MKLDKLSFSLSTVLKAMLAIGLLQVAAYYFVGTMASPDNHVAVPQPDTLLYCQSARMVAEGQPFVFTPGDKPSTGCTSHLYPFVLAVPYLLGAKGDALLTAGFVLNALFYLIFLACWGVIVWRLFPEKNLTEKTATAKPGSESRNRWTPLLACTLIASYGQSAFAAFSQSDTGLFMAISAMAIALLFCEKYAWFSVLLAVSPWCRPEGMILILSFLGILILRCLVSRVNPGIPFPPKNEWGIAGVALLSCAGVFLLNYGLTGIFEFQSVAYKGYFKVSRFLPAFSQTMQDMVGMIKDLFLGMPSSSPRDLFYLPFLGAVFAWIGIFLWDWKKSWKLVWGIISALGTLSIVAASMWQGTNCDRYLAWMFPFWLVFMAVGAVWTGEKLSWCKALPALLLIAFQTAESWGFISLFYLTSIRPEQSYDFVKETAPSFSPKAVFGMPCYSGAMYGLPGHTLRHLAGLYSPDFFCRDTVTNLELLKHRPDLRFDVWAFFQGKDHSFFGVTIESLLGRQYALNLNGEAFYDAKWSSLDEAIKPERNGQKQQKLLTRYPHLMDWLDVGYLADEKRCSYKTNSRLFYARYAPFGMQGTLNGKTILEVGRTVIGWDEMDLRLQPRKDAILLLRTANKAETDVDQGLLSKEIITFASPLKLRLRCDGQDAGISEHFLQEGSNTFSEIVLTIPGKMIQRPSSHLEIFGDHAAFAYWAFQ